MANKRVKGITVFAWLTIIFNGLNMLAMLDYRSYFELFKSLPKNLIIGSILYGLISSLLGLIVGIGILKLIEITRKIGIGINCLDLVVGVPLFLFSFNDIRLYTHKVVQSEMASNPTTLNINAVVNAGLCVIVLYVVATTIISILFIYYFTRPKIKALFIPEGA